MATFWLRGSVSGWGLEAQVGMLMEDMIACGDAETTACKEHWSREDPTHGHCVVFSLLTQDIFGGHLLRADLAHLPEYSHMRSHYWNRLENGIELDLTSNQFNGGDDRGLLLFGEMRTREYLLSNADTARRYGILKKRLMNFHDSWKSLLNKRG